MLNKSVNLGKAIVSFALIFCIDFTGPAQTAARKNSSLSPKVNDRVSRFERELEQLRTVLKIPGMSAAIVKDQQIVWTKGFGYSDYENKVPSTPETPYEIASLTKTFAATLLMQLVEQGKVSLDDPMSKYSDSYKDDQIRVRHVLTHTSGGTAPGETYEYNGNVFANLFDVIVKGSGQRLRPLIVKNILEKLGTTGTAPGNDLNDRDADHAKMAQLIGAENERAYVETLQRLAKPYKLYGANEIIGTYNQRRGLDSSTGMISTVTDLAKWDAALDRHLFLKPETQERMWTPTISITGKVLPYGLGWFVQNYREVKLIWHNGNLPDLYSGLILKVPYKHLTFIVLANSDALSSPFRLAKGDVMTSAFAQAFMRTFVFEDEYKTSLPTPTWGANEKDFLYQIGIVEKQYQGYKYDQEVAANVLIRAWLDNRIADAHKEIKLDPKKFEAFVGKYQVGNNAPFAIIVDSGHLIRLGKIRFELFPASETEFFAKAVDALFTFLKDDKGNVTQVKIKQGENEVVARKVTENKL